MKRQKNITYYIGFFLILLMMSSCSNNTSIKAPNFEQIQSNFITPADTNSIWCYWYWINDDISKDGITKDLEAMKKAGIGGALI